MRLASSADSLPKPLNFPNMSPRDVGFYKATKVWWKHLDPAVIAEFKKSVTH